MSLIGSKEGIGHLPLAFINPGDVVLVPDPGYPVYHAGTVFAGGESVVMPLHASNGFLPDLQQITPEHARRAKIDVPQLSQQPHRCRGTEGIFRGGCRVRPPTRHHRLPRCGILGGRLRRISPGEFHGSRWGARRRHRNAFLVEDLQYDRVAHRLCCGQCADPGRLGDDQDEPRFGRVHGRTGCCHSGAERAR